MLVLVQLGELMTIMVVLYFTGIGNFSLSFGLSEMQITIMMIPVIIGAITLGPIVGMILGVLFGLSEVFSPASQPLMEVNMWAVVGLNIAVRGIGLGALCGGMFKLLRKIDKSKVWSYEATGLVTVLLNTLITVGGLVLIFGANPENIGFPDGMAMSAMFSFFITAVGVQTIVEALICTLAASIAAKAIVVYLYKN